MLPVCKTIYAQSWITPQIKLSFRSKTEVDRIFYQEKVLLSNCRSVRTLDTARHNFFAYKSPKSKYRTYRIQYWYYSPDKIKVRFSKGCKSAVTFSVNYHWLESRIRRGDSSSNNVAERCISIFNRRSSKWKVMFQRVRASWLSFNVPTFSCFAY